MDKSLLYRYNQATSRVLKWLRWQDRKLDPNGRGALPMPISLLVVQVMVDRVAAAALSASEFLPPPSPLVLESLQFAIQVRMDFHAFVKAMEMSLGAKIEPTCRKAFSTMMAGLNFHCANYLDTLLALKELLEQCANSNTGMHLEPEPLELQGIGNGGCSLMEDTTQPTFLAYLHAKSCNELVDYVETVWRDYRQRKTTLLAASSATTAAYQTVKQWHADMESLYPAWRDHSGFVSSLMKHFTVPYSERPPLDDIQLGENGPYLSRFLMFDTYQCAAGFYANDCPHYMLFEDFHKRFDEESPSADYASEWNALQSIGISGCHYISTYGASAKMGGAAFLADVLPNGSKPTHISTSFVVGLELLGRSALAARGDRTLVRALHTMMDSGISMVRQLKRFLEADRKIFPTVTPAQDPYGVLIEQNVAQLLDLIENTLSKDLVERMKVPKTKGVPSFAAYRWNPWLCGETLADAVRLLLAHGILAMNQRRLVISTMHLYHGLLAARHLNALPFLDRVQQLFGSCLFRGHAAPAKHYSATLRSVLEQNQPEDALVVEKLTNWTSATSDASSLLVEETNTDTNSQFAFLEALRALAEEEQKLGILGMNPYALHRLCTRFFHSLREQFPWMCTTMKTNFDLNMMAITFLHWVDELAAGKEGASRSGAMPNVENYTSGVQKVARLMESTFGNVDEKAYEVWFLAGSE